MTEPRRALVLAHEPDGTGANVERRLVERGVEVTTHIITADYDQPQEFVAWPDFGDFDIVVPMGSVRSLTRKDEISDWIHTLLGDLRVAHDRGQPILGVCFGGQLLTDALGGHVEEAPHSVIGWGPITDGPDGPNPVGAGPWMMWHHDRMVPPADVEVLATTEMAPQLIRSGRSVGTQFHPEVDVAHIDGFLANAPDEYLAENGVTRAGIEQAVRENAERNLEQCAALVDWFLDEVACLEHSEVSVAEGC